MQSKSRRIKRLVLGLQNPKRGGSKRDVSRLQFINCNVRKILKEEYLTPKGQKLLVAGVDEGLLTNYKKKRYESSIIGKEKLKVIFHSRVKPLAAKVNPESI